MKLNTKYLYDLLPAYYRMLDEEQGKPLEAFISILAREGGIVEDHIAQLYENWFIETCEEWVVPYIGDLLGVKSIHEIDGAAFSRRAYIANTMAYRRRKGTAPVIEQLAFDVTGWRSKVVEFFQLLATSQNVNHIRLHNTATPDLREMNALDLINTAFDKQGHTVDVGRISAGLGKYNIQNIGIYLWRLNSYPLGDKYNEENEVENEDRRYVDARKKDSGADIPDGAFTFSPIGFDTHLFNIPQTEDDIVHLAEEINVPGLLRRRALYDELEAARAAIANVETPVYRYFEPGYPPVFELFVNGNIAPVPPEEIVICNLSEWHVPPASKIYKKYVTDSDGTVTVIDVPLPITAAVDPVLGRIVFSSPGAISEVLVNYSHGFSGDVSGGPYDRRFSLLGLEDIKFDWHVGVSKDHTPVQTETIYQTLEEATVAWNALGTEGITGLITVMDNRTYGDEEDAELPLIEIPEGSQLYIIAADWPVIKTSGIPERIPGKFNPENVRPHIKGNIAVKGKAPSDSPNGGGLLINGLLIEGNVKVKSGNLNSCAIHHCTLVPGLGGFEAEPQESILQVSLKRSVCGPVQVAAEGALASLEESIIDNREGVAISVPEGQLGIQKCTIFGTVEARSLDAGNSIFNDPINIVRRQAGCVRFSYLPLDSISPRRYRCQPELEIQTQIRDRREQGPLSPEEEQAIRGRVLNWLLPVFNSTTYGHHAYCQLGTTTPKQITAGADNAAEMGLFNYLQQPQRVANLHIVLEEYLRLGLEAGIIYVT